MSCHAESYPVVGDEEISTERRVKMVTSTYIARPTK